MATWIWVRDRLWVVKTVPPGLAKDLYGTSEEARYATSSYYQRNFHAEFWLSIGKDRIPPLRLSSKVPSQTSPTPLISCRRLGHSACDPPAPLCYLKWAMPLDIAGRGRLTAAPRRDMHWNWGAECLTKFVRLSIKPVRKSAGTHKLRRPAASVDTSNS